MAEEQATPEVQDEPTADENPTEENSPDEQLLDELKQIREGNVDEPDSDDEFDDDVDEDFGSAPSDDDAPVAEADDDAGDDIPAAEESWINDSIRYIAEQKGFSQEDLDALGSEAAFLVAARQVEARTESPQEDVEQKEESFATPQADALEKAGFEDELVEFARQMEIKAAKQEADFMHSVQQQQAQQEYNAFHDTLDLLDEKIYGVTLDEKGAEQEITNEQEQARNRIMDEVLAERERLVIQNKPIPPTRTLINEAHRRLNHETLAARERKKHNDKIRQRAKRKSASGDSRNAASDLVPDGQEYPGDLMNTLADIRNRGNE